VRHDIVAVYWLRIDSVKCVREVEEGDLPDVARFIVDAGEIDRLGDENFGSGLPDGEAGGEYGG